MHHFHRRKKTDTSNNALILFNKFMYVIAIVVPFSTIPQIEKIWVNKSAQNISLFTWATYTFSAACWLVYAIAHKEKVLIINAGLWL
ncbi:hypothetical protein KKC32_03615, partial [Patescibacteria group bacterium]|nr:hypothetical protein [Patescibacteria group bacterium]